MTSPTISIIVPVYNVEQYLHRCLDSILAQTFTDFEVLVVDDGSPDRCGEICDEYAKKDSRIRVFHKENGGVSSARNLGIHEAKGGFICFVDSDDIIRPNYLQTLLSIEENTNADMIVGSAVRKTKSKNLEEDLLLKDKVYDKIQYAQMLYDMRKVCLWGVPWNKLFKIEIIRGNNLEYDLSLDSYEDEVFNLEYLQYTNTVASTHTVIYDSIVARSNSLSQRFIEIDKHLRLAETIYNLGLPYAHNDFYRKEICLYFMRHFSNSILWQYSRLKHLPKKQRLYNINKVINSVPSGFEPYFQKTNREKHIYFKNKYLIDLSMIMLLWLKKRLHRI